MSLTKVTLRPISWQVGRHGEVAGGMTQVVNSYLNWEFEDFDVKVIASRDGSRGIKAMILFLSAVIKIFLIRNQKDILVVHLSQGGSFIREGFLLKLGNFLGLGTVAHIHGSSFVDFTTRYAWLVKWVLCSANQIVVLSDATKSVITKLTDESKVKLIPNAVPLGNASNKEKLIIFGGGVSKRKGIDVLVEAWKMISNKNGWRLLIAGPILEPEIVPSKLDDSTFLGSIPHQELMTLLDKSAIAVLPSRDEAMPMFILEALARDNCVISTNVGGIPTLLSDQRGLLIEPGNVIELVNSLNFVMENDSSRELLTLNGKKSFLENYSALAIYPKIEKLWINVSENRLV